MFTNTGIAVLTLLALWLIGGTAVTFAVAAMMGRADRRRAADWEMVARRSIQRDWKQTVR